MENNDLEAKLQGGDSAPWIPVARLKSETDASLALSLLQQKEIECRRVVDTADGSFTIEIRNPADRHAAVDILERLVSDHVQRNVARRLSTSPSVFVFRFPVVALALLLSVLGALLVSFKFEWVHLFTFQDFQLSQSHIYFSSPEAGFSSGQYWRLLTPAFLHFGLFHLAFNSLWIWELGRRIEALAGSLHLLTVILMTAVFSNVAQYVLEGASLFGGMSGSVYGLLGYIWLRNRMAPTSLLTVAPGLFVLMIGWLLVCMTGLIDLFLQGSVANGAHLGGLISGVILGGVFGFLERTKKTGTDKNH